MLRVNQCIRLGSELYKTTQETALLRSSKCMITVKRGTLVVNILKKGKLMGYVFYGKAKLCLDAIIETSEGALGKAITKEFNGPFIMLMGGEVKQAVLSTVTVSSATNDDFTKAGCKNAQNFVEIASNTWKKFLRHVEGHWPENEKNMRMFAFPQNDIFEIVLSSRDGIVYATTNTVYILKGDIQALGGSREIMVTRCGKSVSIKYG
ncbi:hypothetical protein DRO29_01000 [Candidatus Bathyarchaeota archaeon]|nr:MAG: hypothetical protein DRO29_01000 [Candidatus Bathyarchaeota archaeon]